MRKQTDLVKVKQTARSLLFADIHETEFSPVIVSHPFTDSGFVASPNTDGEIGLLNITESDDDQRRWREYMGKLIDGAKSASEIYMMVTKPYALTFLKFAMPHLSREDMSQILASAWTRSEAPHQDVNVTVNQLLRMFKQADPTCLMEQDEYIQFKTLDDTVTVYRGVTPHNAKSVKALSWSLNQETAEWFAHRFGENGTVYEAQIDKKHIYAYFGGRNESEVIVDPSYLTNITEVPAIFTREERAAILALMAQRQIKDRKSGGHPLSKLLRCSECGHSYRRIVTPKDVLWRCAYRNSGKTDCTIYTVREEDVCRVFITAINKLRAGRDNILIPMIERLEAMQSKVNGTTVRLSTIDKEIAVLSRQSLVIAELLNQGILEPSDFAAQNNELSQKIFHLRSKRRELLAINETDDMLNALRELADMLEDMETEMSDYDEDIVRAIIKNATVVSDTELKIHLHGGLTVTEYLPQYYSRRCKHQ